MTILKQMPLNSDSPYVLVIVDENNNSVGDDNSVLTLMDAAFQGLRVATVGYDTMARSLALSHSENLVDNDFILRFTRLYDAIMFANTPEAKEMIDTYSGNETWKYAVMPVDVCFRKPISVASTEGSEELVEETVNSLSGNMTDVQLEMLIEALSELVNNNQA